MNNDKWQEFYEKICLDLDIDPESDYRSSVILSEILGDNSTLSLLESFRKRDAHVIGNGPDLEGTLSLIGEDALTIVADSALPTFMEKKGKPDLVITDLDGNIESLKRAHDLGSVMIIHSHGDNIPEIKDFGSYFSRNCVGTTQGKPLHNIFNFHGFTDGDRGAFLAHFLGSPKITLVAFDFENASEKAGSNRERKLKKLKWARILLEELAVERGTTLGVGNLITL